MLRTMVDYNVMFYVMGVVAAVGVCSKLVSQFALKRLVRASGNMNKSTHKLMKLMRAKYEHACMVSDKVQNVRAFVDKYVFEYRILGLRLHTWQQMQKQTMWMSALLGVLGACMYYQMYGMGEAVYRYAGSGAVLMVLLFLLHITTDEKYLLRSSETYMVDYLENVCAHRYEKLYQREGASAVKRQREIAVNDAAYETEGTAKHSLKDRLKKEVHTISDRTASEAALAGMASTVPVMTGQEQTGSVSPMTDVSAAETVCEEETPQEAIQMQEAFARTSAEGMGTKQEASGRILTEEHERIEAEADAVPKEAMIREILEEFLAQRT